MQFSKTASMTILPEGGLNTETSKLAIPPGQMIGCSNVEIGDPLGWRRADGYERFDGHPRPHLAEYTAYETTHINDAVSGASFAGPTGSGILLEDYDSSSTEIYLYVETGTVTSGDTLVVAATNICTLTDLSAADTLEDSVEYTQRAVTAARANISEVPGTGDINGVWSYKGVVYTFRDGKMYGSSTTGWTEVVFPLEVEFDDGYADAATSIHLVGDTVTNGTATADIVGIQKTNGATFQWTNGDAAGVLTLANITGGTFSDEDDLTFSTAGTELWNGPVTVGASWTDNDDGTYTADTGSVSDLEITSPPLEVDKTYIASLTIDSISAGNVTLPYDGDAGNEVTQTTAGTYEHEFTATATTLKIVNNSSDAVISGVTVSEPVTALATTDQTQITLNTGGRYEFDNYNFSGAADRLKMYGVDGANHAFEFDGTNFIQIRTGLEDDTPSHMFIMNFQMFVSKEGSWLLSPLGDVFGTWENVRGSDEWGMGDYIIGAVTTPGGTALSFARNSIAVIYPTDSGYYGIKPYASDYGALEWSIQNALTPVCISDGGVTLIQPTDKFGDFETGQVDEVIRDLMIGLRESFVASVVFRNKKEYRMYFTNGICVRLKFGRDSVIGFTLDEYPLVVRGCTASVRSDRYLTDTEVEKDHVFFYSDDGYVYQMNVGDSFDGADIPAYFELPWNHLGTPYQKKRWYDVTLEVETDSVNTEIGIKPVYNMYDAQRTDVIETRAFIDLPGGIWSEVNWNEFYWSSSPTGGMYKVRLRSTTPGLGLMIASKGGGTWNIRSITTRFSGRGEVR